MFGGSKPRRPITRPLDRRTPPACLSLDRLPPGKPAVIRGFATEAARVQVRRLGLDRGTLVRCLVKFPRGPVVIGSGFQEIALGRRLAAGITVELLPPPGREWKPKEEDRS
ncbi:MAG: ferrous iron transport protein A [Firmicutes bacterium]|nr:ferrous iron transport protein A [Bacillota bacterium]